jgi:hypothetical protein
LISLGTPISIDWALLETGERYEQDQILQELFYIKNRISTSAAIFTDKAKAAFFFVVIPEAGIINATEGGPDVRAVRRAGRRPRSEPGRSA